MKVENSKLITRWLGGDVIRQRIYHLDDIEPKGEPFDDGARKPRPYYNHGWTFMIERTNKAMIENELQPLFDESNPKNACILMPFDEYGEPNKKEDVHKVWREIMQYKVIRGAGNPDTVTRGRAEEFVV